MTLQQSVSQCQLPNTLLLISTLGMAQAAQHKEYGCVFHRNISTVIQDPLNILVSVSCAEGTNVTSAYAARKGSAQGQTEGGVLA